ncbi:MAG TPA: class I SAM-dependent methyltransferase [Candidatus Hydrogenedentes bacterium]|nr:class I SAM-dependent methyltransferase [Candidatus Hydrogenedentota bacterium]HPG67997.1 class I SAM-dependent methyltransferase [Candidatus Hydrogenedentota bacterium]
MDTFSGYNDRPEFAEFYDCVPVYVKRGDVDFYIRQAQLAEGSTLELGCGTGRILLPMAEAGCRVVGLDLSDSMLARCREKLDQKPQDVKGRTRLVLGNMVDFDQGETYALITIPFRAFQHVVCTDDQMACLGCVNRHLEVGGRLIVDLFQVNMRYLCSPDCLKEIEDFSGVGLPGGRVLKRTHRFAGLHPAEQYNDAEMIYYVTHPDGREERLVQGFPFRYFFRYEVEHLLERTGFRVVDVFGNYDESAFGDNSPEMIFIAEKASDLRDETSHLRPW